MPRHTKIETDLLINLIHKFYIEKCNNDPTQLKLPQIGQFVRSQGYDVADYLIRRNEDARNYIQSLKDSAEEIHLHYIAVYKDLDIGLFLQKNNTREKLMKAIKERENYYREIAESAAYFFKENKELSEKISQHKKEREVLKKDFEETKMANTQLALELRTLQKDHQKLLQLVEDYLYPEIANEILKKDGFLKTTANIVDLEKMEGKLIDIDTDVSAIKNNLIKDLFHRL